MLPGRNERRPFHLITEVIMNVPINAMIDRHDYPIPPSSAPAPIAKVR